MSKVFNENQVPIVDYIIGRYFDPDQVEENEILELIDNVKEDVINDMYCGHTLLQIATHKNHINVVKELLKFENIELNSIGCGGFPLLIALRQGNIDIFQLLFDHPKIDVNCSGIYNYSAFNAILNLACKIENLKIFKYLLNDERINPNTCHLNNLHQQSYLIHKLVCSNKKQIFLEVLLDHPSININVRDYQGNAPLHCIAYNNNIENLEILLKKPNLDTNRKNNKGLSAIDIASMKGYYTCLDLIMKYNSDKN